MNLFFKAILLSIMVFVALQASAQRSKKTKKDKKETVNDAGFAKPDKFHERFFEGMREYGLENYDKAEIAFKDCLNMDPASVACMFQLSKIYWAMGTKSEAINYAEKGFKLEPQNEDLYQNYLAFLLQTRYYSSAISATNTFLNTLKSDSKRIKYSRNLSQYYEYNRDYINAIEVYKKLEKEFGFTNAYSLERLRLYKAAGFANEAFAEIDLLIANNPNSAGFLYQKANLYRDKGNTSEALIYYNKALEINANHAQSLLESGEILVQIDKEKGSERLLKSFANTQIDINAKINTYNSLGSKGIEKSILHALAIVLQENHAESPSANKALADSYFRMNKNNEGLPYLEKAHQLDPGNFGFTQELLEIYYRTHNYNKLAVEGRNAADLYPTQSMFYLYAGIGFTEIGDYNNALIMLESGKSYILGNSSQRQEFDLSMAALFFKMKEFDESDKIFEALMVENPNNATVLNNFAYFLAKRGQRLDEAEKMVTKALLIEGDNASYFDTYGFVFFAKKNYPKAIEYYKKALELAPNNAEILEHIGDAYYFDGQTRNANTHWFDAKQASENPTELLLKKIADGKYYAE